MPDDYRRRQTIKSAERYITPELKSFEDKALSANDRALAREKFLFEELLTKLAPHVPALQRVAQALAELDGLCTFADNAVRLDLSMPEFVDHDFIDIVAGRHPVVEQQVDNFIANDLRLSREHQLAVITGPNMGGNSTDAVTARSSCSLTWAVSCQPSASIGPVDQIFTRISSQMTCRWLPPSWWK